MDDMVLTIDNDEQLCMNDKGQASLFKEGGCEIDESVYQAVGDWYRSMKNY